MSWFRFSAALALAFVATNTAFAQLPAIESVTYDQAGRFHVNGKPFFPILLYDVPLDEATLRELREFGFNVLVCDGKPSASLPAKGFYGAVHASKKIDDLTGVFLGLGADSPALYFKKDLLKQVAEANDKTRAVVRGRPIMNAIGYWENEPAGVFAGTLPSKAKYDDLVAGIDVSGPYLYPIPYQPVASVGDAIARARTASVGKKPVIPILQLFVWKEKDRYPTAAELRCMAFLALVEGAHGIGYYSFGSVTGRPKRTIAAVEPALWKSVKNLNHDIADIGRRLLAGASGNDLALLKNSGPVRMKFVREKNAGLAVIVNPAASRQEVKLNAPKEGSAKLVLQNGKQVEIKEGSATLALEPFGVEIIRLLQHNP
jgi:hypothetical protein